MHFKRTILSFALLLTALCSRSQQFNFKNYSVKDGVAQSQVYSVIQDSRGYLWLGTRGGGITRFDGIRFKTFTQKEGLSNNYVFCIREDKNHNLWIGTNNGVSHYNGVAFKNYPSPDSTQQLMVLDIAFDQKNRIWLATNQGVLMLEGGTFTNVTVITGGRIRLINTIATDYNGTIWFGDAMGLCKLEAYQASFKETRLPRMQKGIGTSVQTLEFDRSGTLWIGTYGAGLFLFKQGRFSRLADNPELDEQSIFDIYFDTSNAWLATLNRGVCQYNLLARSFSWLGENEGLSNNHVRSITRDKSNNYWFGTSGGGVCNYFGKQFTTYDKSSGLAGNFIYSIYRDSRQRLFAGTSDKGFSILDSGRFINYNASNRFFDVKVKALCEDLYGNIYIGTEADGLYIFRDSLFTVVDEFAGKYIRAMVRDKDGNIYVGTTGHGIYKIIASASGEPSVKFIGNKSLLSSRISCLHYDKTGRVWYGTESQGIGFIVNDSISKPVFTSPLPSGTIRCFTEDRKGYLWVGTAGSGIFSMPLYQGDFRIKAYSYKEGLSSANIYLLTSDAFNHLFSGSETGLDMITLDSTDRSVQSIKHFSKGEGFTGIETCQNSVFNDSNGTIWFGTINGLTRYFPASKYKNEVAPIVSLLDVRLFYQGIAGTEFGKYLGDWNHIDNITFPYNQNHLSFDFQGINFSNPEAVNYQWMLVGFDADWSPVSKQATVTYSNIPPGKYTFLVRSGNEDGVWNESPASFNFFITPPFWLRPWVIAIFAFVLALLLYLLFRWRINLVRKKARQQQQQMQMEKDMVELEQKALRLQMNPHFIFNALNSIQARIGTDNEQEARYYLAKFARLMRQILDNSRNATIPLKEEINTLENYLLIEKFCNEDRFDYHIQVDESIETDYVSTPPMLLQPFIENAIKHGLKSLGNKRGLISVDIRQVNGLLEFTVTDNGIGREKSAELNRSSKETYHTSTALLVTRERLELLNMDKSIKTMEIIDLYTENGEASGTRIIIRIPLE